MTLAETLKSDIDGFFRSDEFAIEFTYQLASGGVTNTLNGLFDHSSSQVDDLGSVPVQVNEATITCKMDDLPENAGEGDLVTIGGKAYKVCAPLAVDGQGVVELQLELV
ncbi:head-tail joining protein [Maritalea myrionectae]|uniref:head-tail joining protein n=1 Tax=Maritalea myrionectae TaxID=454601 RepID=UPI00040865ED|nr:hypothetical protein [Maritalea myrionectae]